MKALILNSGLGSRMGPMTDSRPKCMAPLPGGETIVGRQLRLLGHAGVKNAVMTTGPFSRALEEHCLSIGGAPGICFIKNPEYRTTNYIYSIYCARELLDDDILLLHGDLVFERAALERVLNSPESCMAVDASAPLPEKDFKAVICHGRIRKIGVGFFENAVAAQPLYMLKRESWRVWLDEILRFCERGERNCYAENAFNSVSDKCGIVPADVSGLLCGEVDDPKDLQYASERVNMLYEWQ